LIEPLAVRICIAAIRAATSALRIRIASHCSFVYKPEGLFLFLLLNIHLPRFILANYLFISSVLSIFFLLPLSQLIWRLHYLSLPFSSISRHFITYIHLSHILSFTVIPSFRRSTSSSPSFYIQVNHSLVICFSSITRPYQFKQFPLNFSVIGATFSFLLYATFFYPFSFVHCWTSASPIARHIARSSATTYTKIRKQ
jgi:hypothetical protein